MIIERRFWILPENNFCCLVSSAYVLLDPDNESRKKKKRMREICVMDTGEVNTPARIFLAVMIAGKVFPVHVIVLRMYYRAGGSSIKHAAKGQ